MKITRMYKISDRILNELDNRNKKKVNHRLTRTKGYNIINNKNETIVKNKGNKWNPI